LAILKKYKAVFSKGGMDMGECNIEKVHIDTGDAKPIACNPHRLPYHLRETMKEELGELLGADIIEESDSPWAAPCLYVPKKDGTWRLCVDFRKLNSVIKPMVYPLPRIEDIFDTLEGSVFFTAIDLAKGFWQIALDDESKQKAAFTTIYGQFQYRRLPFGLATSPGAFQKVMNTVLAGLNWVQCMVYLDDILVFSSTFEQHLATLEKIFQRLLKANLKIKLSKCEWARTELNYLGHVINSEGKMPDPKKVSAIKELEPPKNVKDVMSFLGKVGYYHKFIQDFSNLAYPLNQLKRKGEPWVWGTEQQKAFEALRDQLCSAPVLKHPDFSRPFVLQTDASGYGLGAVLTQYFDDGEHPIAYASRTLEDRETRHAIIEKEALAIAWGIHHFRHYLLGRHFTVQTDHKPLLALQRIKDQNARLQKLSLRLQGYRFTIEYRKGIKNQNADLLSRYPQKPLKGERKVGPSPSSVNMAQMVEFVGTLNFHESFVPNNEDTAAAWRNLKNLQEEDIWFGSIIRFLRDDLLPEDPKTERAVLANHMDFVIDENLLYRCNNKAFQLCVPMLLRRSVCHQVHDVPAAGHLGMKKSYQRLVCRFYWPTMHKDLDNYIRYCPECSRHKPPSRRHKEPLGDRELPNGPWETVHMDIWSPGKDAPFTRKGNRMVIAFKDAFTKYVIAVPIPNRSAETVSDVIVNHILPQEGPPARIVSDNAMEFTSRAQQRVFEMFGITRQLITPRDPKSNGQIERFFRPFRTILASLANHDRNDWDSYVPHAVFAYNTSVHRAVRNTPFFLMKGRDPELLLQCGVPDPRATNVRDIPLWLERLSVARQMVKAHLQEAREVNRRYYNQTANPQQYNVGDVVLRAIPPPAGAHGPRKLYPKYIGPYRIARLIGKTAYLRSIAFPRTDESRYEMVDLDKLRHCDQNRFVGPPIGGLPDPAEVDPYLDFDLPEEEDQAEAEAEDEAPWEPDTDEAPDMTAEDEDPAVQEDLTP
jgi:hypothetical protein